MHIPTSDTTQHIVIPFSQALEEALLPQPDYDVSRWLYVPHRYCDYRYILGTRGSRPLICVGINPSTAAPNALDNTLKSVERIALGNGYDSFIMFNVYAQRATRPDDMEKQCNPALHQENMAAFRWALEQTRGGSPAVWAAWGAIIEKRPYLTSCLSDMLRIGRDLGACWYSAGARSKKGHPHHPLYLRKDSKLDPFDAALYVEQVLAEL